MIASLLAGLMLAQTGPVWNVHPSGTLVWAGQPYIPYGVRVAGTEAAIREAAADGVRDFLVELPSDGRGWQSTFTALRETQSRFFVELNSMAPPTLGWAVEPESYRLTGITERTRLRAQIPGAQEALIVLATLDGSIQSVRRVPTSPSGALDEEIDPASSAEHIALVYPLLRDARVPQAWEEMDQHRDRTLSAFQTAGEAPGLRGVFNPVGTIAQFPPADLRFVPNSDRFRLELETYLKQKYTSLRRAEQAWAVTTADFNDFTEMARLIPLWSTRRGVAFLYDPVRATTYRVENRNSQAWNDIQFVTQTALRRRVIHMSQSLQAALGVPVLQTWRGWNGPYEGNAAGLAGVAVRLEGDRFSSLIDGAARAASTLSRWSNPGLLMATDIAVPPSDDRGLLIDQLVTDSRSLGMRGWFVSNTTADERKRIASLSDAVRTDTSLLGSKPTFLHFPESSLNPVVPMRIGSGPWWVPAPVDGNRLDFGREFGGYRMRTPEGDQTIIWANREPIRLKLRAVSPQQLSFRTVDGSDPKPKVGRRDVEVTIGTSPLIITGVEIPIPEIVIEETIDEFAGMVALVPQELQNLVDDVEAFRQLSTTVNQDPSGAYFGMRARLERLRRSLAPMVWMEGETSRTNTFSEIISDPAASGGAALSLSTRVLPMSGHFSAQYTVNPRFTGQQEIWASVRGSSEAIRSLRAWVDDAELEPVQPVPLGIYGTGFGWVNLGAVNLNPRPMNLQIRVPAPIAGPISLDAIVVTPADYRPSGPFLNWNPPVPQPEQRRRR